LSYKKLKPLECSNLKVYSVEGLAAEDLALIEVRASDYKFFCFCMASYFSRKLLSDYNSITYIDSDIYFHLDIENIFNEIKGRDVGIFRHRQYPLHSYSPNGLFNVGVVFFNGTETGRRICSWWADAVLNKRFPEHATCGDQKYLDLFPTLCSPSSIYVDENIGHGAPWQWQLYEFLGNNKIKWGNHKQELVFTHFSQFKDNGDTYIPSTDHYIYTPLSLYNEIGELKSIYDEYHSNIKKVIKKYNT
jgi:hypothetical protein